MAADDILTEGEIDALLAGVDERAAHTADRADDGQYRRFDFSGREHLLLREFTALGGLLERQAELLRLALENAFSLEFVIRALPAQLLSVADALASLGRSFGVSTTLLTPLEGPGFALAPQSLLSFVVNAYFGGALVDAPRAPERANLTPTELRVAERIAQQQFAGLQAAWSDKLALQSGDMQTLDTPDRLEALPRGDLLLRLRFVLCSGAEEFALDLLLPFAPLEPYRERFAPPRESAQADAANRWEPFWRRELPLIEVELAGVLAAREIALCDLLELAPGAVIPIPAPEQVSVRVDGVTLAQGRYGSFEGAKAVQLQRLGRVLTAQDA